MGNITSLLENLVLSYKDYIRHTDQDKWIKANVYVVHYLELILLKS